MISTVWPMFDTIVMVVIFTHEGRSSSGKVARISSSVNKYEKELFAIDEYISRDI
tara:strand:- start:2190 stop:2354 length:165 start_codon:yes stop_codon:yes gene_type:complete